MRKMASWLLLRASLRSWGTKCESRQDDRAGQVERWSTEMEMLVLQKWQVSGKRSNLSECELAECVLYADGKGLFPLCVRVGWM